MSAVVVVVALGMHWISMPPPFRENGIIYLPPPTPKRAHASATTPPKARASPRDKARTCPGHRNTTVPTPKGPWLPRSLAMPCTHWPPLRYPDEPWKN